MFAVTSEFSILKEAHGKMNPHFISCAIYISKRIFYFCLADDGNRLRIEEPTFSHLWKFHMFLKVNLLRKVHLESVKG